MKKIFFISICILGLLVIYSNRISIFLRNIRTEVPVYDIVGEFAFERIDLHIDNDVKHRIISDCNTNKFKNFGKYNVERVESLDGYKFFFDEDTWLMIRPSGTEPVLRVYAEAFSQEEAINILNIAKETILKE